MGRGSSLSPYMDKPHHLTLLSHLEFVFSSSTISNQFHYSPVSSVAAACRLEPDSPSHLWNKASVHQQMNEPGKAVDAYQQLHKVAVIYTVVDTLQLGDCIYGRYLFLLVVDVASD